MKVELNYKDLENALVGGAILGGGGGGSVLNGRQLGEETLKIGKPQLISIDELADEETIITVSAVGAPAAKDKFITSEDYIYTIKKLEKDLQLKIGGVITNENGGSATINGWLQSVLLGVPLIDAPCNGRAHPTGAMGSMNLDKDDKYISYQSFSGGNPENGMKINGIVSGTISTAAKLVRQGAIAAGGLVAVARNPVSSEYVKKNAAVGGITHAIKIGEAFNKGISISPKEAIKNICNELSGEIITAGPIEKYEIETVGGFDVGKLVINGYETTFWNEYMTLEKDGKRLGTFPDLIMTFNLKTGYPVTTAEIKEGMELIIFHTNAENLKLGSSMKNKELLKEVELIINKKIVQEEICY